MKLFFYLAFTLCLFTKSLTAATINLDAELLRDASGRPLAVNGLVVLTATTNGAFSGPTDTLFASGAELVLKKWNLSAFGTAGLIQDTTSSFSYSSFSSSLAAGNLLKIYWYPTLTLDSLAPGANTSYGSFRDTATTTSALLDGASYLWQLPGESGAISLKFATTDATFLFTGGSNSPTSATASLTTVPEPTIYLGGALFGLALWVCRRVSRV